MATQTIAPAGPAAHGVRGAASALARAVRAVFRTIAHARMLSALHHMSDAQLARIGVARADIPAYALALSGGADATGEANLR